MDDSEVRVYPQSAMSLIAVLGKDEQVGKASGAGSDTSRYNFIVADEVASFFVLLHDFTEEYLSQSNLETHGDKIVIACLKAMSTSCEIREAWKGICRRKFLTEVQVAVLQRVSTMFVKSKQSIIREKLDLKPQKGSLSLRQDLKSKTSKKSTCTKSESEATKTPPTIKELAKHFATSSPGLFPQKMGGKSPGDEVEHFEDPEITSRCLVEISKGNDPEGDLNHLTGKHHTKLLKAFGLPAL